MDEAGLRPKTSPMLRDLWVRFGRWVIMSPVVWPVFVANLGGSLAGYVWWYGGRLAEVPWYLWVFVPDCPLAATLMAFALVAFHYGRRWEFLGALAAGMCMKYGLWTVFYWIMNRAGGGHYGVQGIVMSLSHFVMLIEGLILTTFLRFRPVPLAVAGLFLIANDVVDWATRYTPRVPDFVDPGVLAAFAVAETAVIVVFWVAMSWISVRRPDGAAARLEPGGG